MNNNLKQLTNFIAPDFNRAVKILDKAIDAGCDRLDRLCDIYIDISDRTNGLPFKFFAATAGAAGSYLAYPSFASLVIGFTSGAVASHSVHKILERFDR